MPCKSLLENGVIKIGDGLASSYLSRLGEQGLLVLAQEREHHGDAGGQSREEADRHFAHQFVNSAARIVYVSTDPTGEVADASSLVRQSFTDGRVLLVEVPCGSGAGTLGLLSALCEYRRTSDLPTLPLNVDVLGGDISDRAIEHFTSLVSQLSPHLAAQKIDVELHAEFLDVTNLKVASGFIDKVVALAGECDQVFLLVSNFSDALTEVDVNESFQHFLSQFSGRMKWPNTVCWVEPNSNKAESSLKKFQGFFVRLLKMFKTSEEKVSIRYHFLDPVRDRVVQSGLRLLRATQERMP